MHRFSTYLGGQLLGTFTLPSEFHCDDICPGARVMHFMTNASVVRTVTRDGTLLAEHHLGRPVFLGPDLTSGWQDGSMLAVARTGETLFVCSPAGSLSAISLGRPAMDTLEICPHLSSCDALAAVCIIGLQSEVVFVDLSRQCVASRHALPIAAGVKCYEICQGALELAQSRHSLALCPCHGTDRAEARALSISGEELFVIPDACSLSWDQLGIFLAVAIAQARVCVYNLTGSCVISFSGLRPLERRLGPLLQWQPGTTQLRCTGRGPGDSIVVSFLECSF